MSKQRCTIFHAHQVHSINCTLLTPLKPILVFGIRDNSLLVFIVVILLISSVHEFVSIPLGLHSKWTLTEI